jgi:hypothetical protein
MVRPPEGFLRPRLRPGLGLPLAFLLTLWLHDLARGAAERHLEWDATGQQRCEACGARRDLKVWGVLTFADGLRAAEDAPRCGVHDWVWSGCASTRFGILCYW